MKILTLNIFFAIATAVQTTAQDNTPIKKADFANWVIESNVKTPRNSIVRFYNAKQELIYQEEINGKKLNVNRTKVRTKLDGVLANLIAKNNKVDGCNLVAFSLTRK